MATNKTNTVPPGRRRDFWVLLACLLVIFAVLFHKSFLPEYVLHNNDNPVGANAQAALKAPEAFKGMWADLNWLGFEWGMMSPNLSWAMLWQFGPVWYAKFFQPLSLIILGLSGWVFLRSLRLSSFACVLGGLAFALHGDPFSNCCWGQVSRPMSLATMLLALTALQNGSGVRYWLRALAAGMAVGWGVLEGFDLAGLYSVIIGIFTVYHVWVTQEGSLVKKAALSVLRLVLVAAFAVCVAAAAVTSLIGFQVKGASGMEQDAQTKAERWGWATQWSMPKAETLGALVPGLFGYRMDTPNGGQYWGASGRDVAWDAYFESGKQGPPPQGFIRFGGAGCYSGPVIVILALWGFLQSLRKRDSPFGIVEKKFIWFWAGLWVVCLLLAWGRFAPFYQFFYALPYASTIRNPSKFFHICDWSLLVLFGYGVHALSKKFWETRTFAAPPNKNWWLNAPSFDRRWVVGSVLAVGMSLLCWLIYGSSTESLQRYLQEVQFDAGSAAEIARFSIKQVGWFVLFLGLGLGVMALVVTGRLSGQRAKLGAIILGVVLVADLAIANLPWIIYWDWKQKYATNELIDQLRERPYEHRVVGLPRWFMSAFQFSGQAAGAEQYLDQLYSVEWAQHEFMYYNIQSLDIVQLPRPPKEYSVYEGALAVRSGETLQLLTRKWELTNTRYILALGAFTDFLNRQFDPGKGRFRIAKSFAITSKEGVIQARKFEELTVVLSTNGPYALIEFTGALPRAKLYVNWQVSTNDEMTLKKLADLSFDPAQSVLIADDIPTPASTTTNQIVGTVEFVSYQPKQIIVKAKVESSAILLLNDRFSPNWQVWVDGKQERLLRCNYLMRGVQLAPGEHKVEFSYRPSFKALQISLTGIAVGFVVLGILLITHKKTGPSPEKKS